MKVDEAGRHEQPIDLGRFDYLDFGASKGGSLELGKKLGGRHGLGIDLDAEKVDQMRSAGYDCVQADVTDLAMPADAVDFVVMSHFLEHLPNEQLVSKSIASGARVAKDFLFIQGPFFDEDDYLAALGLRLYWSFWSGHTCHLTVRRLTGILGELGLRDYQIAGRKPVAGSRDSAVHPLSSPKNQHEYDPVRHGPKPDIAFDRLVFREFRCVVNLGGPRYRRALTLLEGCSALQQGAPGPQRPAPRRRAVADSGHLDVLRLELLKRRRWSYLRYLHVSQALAGMPTLRKVGVVDAGPGIAELALALENPQMDFVVFAPDETPPSVHRSARMAKEWKVKNFALATRWPPPADATFDCVIAAEAAAWREDHAIFLKQAAARATRYLLLVVPHGRGVGEVTLETLNEALKGVGLPDVRGCYWAIGGLPFRELLGTLTDEEIAVRRDELFGLAAQDLIDDLPASRRDALALCVTVDLTGR